MISISSKSTSRCKQYISIILVSAVVASATWVSDSILYQQLIQLRINMLLNIIFNVTVKSSLKVSTVASELPTFQVKRLCWDHEVVC